MARPQLSVLVGDRRASLRTEGDVPVSQILEFRLHGDFSCPVRFIEIDYEKVVFDILSSSQVPFSEDPKGPVEINIYDGDECVLNGAWIILSHRIEDSKQRITIERHGLGRLEFYRPFISQGLFLIESSYKFMDSGDARDVEELALLFTEIKDFEADFPCTLHLIGGGSIDSKFDFESNLKELKSFDFAVDHGELGDFGVSERLVASFVFHTVRYLCVLEVSEVDGDFGVVSCKIPDRILAVSARRYERWHTSFPLRVEHKGETFAAEMTNLSSDGCGLRADGIIPSAGELVRLRFDFGDIEAIVVRSNSLELAVAFCHDGDSSGILREVIKNCPPEQVVARTEETYPAFIDLLERVGYGGRPEWREQSLEAWSKLDDLLPGNTLG